MTVASYQVVVIELFGGLMPATAALRKLNLSTIMYFSEIANDPLEIAAKHWPEAIPLGDIRFLTKDVLQGIVQQHTGALFWLTGGMPRMDDSSFDPSSKGIADECIGSADAPIVFQMLKEDCSAACDARVKTRIGLSTV